MLSQTTTIKDLFSAVADHFLVEPDSFLDMRDGWCHCILGWGCNLLPEWLHTVKSYRRRPKGQKTAIEDFIEGEILNVDLDNVDGEGDRFAYILFRFSEEEMLTYLRDRAWLTDTELDIDRIIWRA